MQSLPPLLAFVAAASVLTLTPGVDKAMVLRAATVDGRRPAQMAALGIALGCLAWGAAVSLGLGALLQASEMAYTCVKVLGAAYLIWLGGKLILAPREVLSDEDRLEAPSDARTAFFRGFLTNVLNPKIGIFYVTFLPQFVPLGANVAGHTFLLACIHVLLTLTWFGALIAATVPLSHFLHRPTVVKTLDRVTGGVFIVFGLKIAGSTTR